MYSGEIINELSMYFEDKVDGYTIFNQIDKPHTEFSIAFSLYNFFNIILNYDRGRFGCNINFGDNGIEIENSQKWYDQSDMKMFCKELDEQIRLRIPDKFLIYNGWS